VRRTARSIAALTGAATVLLVPLAGVASAHVTVQGPGATQDGYTKLTFRAPTEKDVPTTKLEIAFPTDTPISSLRVKPKPGWTYEMTKAAPAVPLEVHGAAVTEVVTRITWSVAAGNQGIAAGEFDEFEVSAGPLPEVDQLVFKALQTYADGEVVRWIEEPVEGDAELEKPAPVLQLAASQESENDAPAADVDAEPVASTDDADGLSIAALVVAGLALATGLAALLRGRRTT
jgi:uncharacterized protein YcnI